MSIMGVGNESSVPIMTYSFPISKDSLEKSVDILIKNNSNITKVDADSYIYKELMISTEEATFFFVYKFIKNEEHYQIHSIDSKILLTAIKKGNNDYKDNRSIDNNGLEESLLIFDSYIINLLPQMPHECH